MTMFNVHDLYTKSSIQARLFTEMSMFSEWLRFTLTAVSKHISNLIFGRSLFENGNPTYFNLHE